VSTVDTEACEVRDKLRLNARFNALVVRLWPMLDAKSKRDFADGQRLWKRFLADECEIVEREHPGGTIRGVMAGSCFVDLTRARVKEVSAMLASRSHH
jgi:uncharacterized protein YecT (DUF1311 family)